MTDKEIRRMKEGVISIFEKFNILNHAATIGSLRDDILCLIGSMQEECNITDIKSKYATGKLKECIDNITEESLTKARKQLQEELVNGGLDLGCGVIWKDEEPASEELEKVVEEIVDPTVLNAYGVKEIANRLRRTMIESVSEEQVKESLISKHEDKTCKENGNSLTQEPVSEDLEKASFDNAQKNYKEGFRGAAMQAFNEGALWQKQKDGIPVSEDLKEAYERYVDKRMALLNPDVADMSCDRDTKMSFDVFDGSEVEAAFYEGANWQKQQLMKDAVEATVKVDAGGYPYVDRTIELYDYDKDIPLAKKGDKYKVILIKED